LILNSQYQNTGRFDAPADGYAMGVTFLMILTGRHAFEGGETLIDFCTGRGADVLADTRSVERPSLLYYSRA